MKRVTELLSATLICFVLIGSTCSAQTVITIGAGTSSSSTRGPFHRSDTNSTTQYSRFVQTYTAAELSAAGIPNGSSISELRWELASSNVIIGSGNANLKIYVKNSSATSAIADTWVNLTTGSTLVYDTDFNTSNNFPGANGWMPFTFNQPFAYTGGALEIAVDWDCSQLSSPGFSGNGAIKWRWESTAPDNLVAKKTSSSQASTTITDLKDERSNIQIVFSQSSPCNPPSNLNAANITSSNADLSWTSSATASSYNWKVVASGTGSGGTAIASGNTAGTMVMATGLSALTSYDLFVESDCGSAGTSAFAGPHTFLTQPSAQGSITIGAGTSSSSTRGPLQRSDTNSTTVYSRFVHIYTAAELANAGLVTGDILTSLSWELASSNIIIGSGNASMKVYVKNSAATTAIADSWSNLIAGSDLVVDAAFNSVNNFPGVNGWMPFSFNAPFTYTGGAIEVAVDWDCSQVSSPAFSGDGSLKWRWDSTAPDDLVAKKTSSSSAPTNISDLKNERANIQMTYAVTSACIPPTGLNVSNIDTSSADLGWLSSSNAAAYNWLVVLAGSGSGGTAIDSGNTTDTIAMTMTLSPGTSYDLFVESDCGSAGTSGFAGPVSFTTTNSNIGLSENLINKFQLAPNPTSGLIELSLDLLVNAEVELKLYNIQGKLIKDLYSGNLNSHTQRIDLSYLQGGMYFVEANINGKAQMLKLIVSK